MEDRVAKREGPITSSTKEKIFANTPRECRNLPPEYSHWTTERYGALSLEPIAYDTHQ